MITVPADECSKCGQDHEGCTAHIPETDSHGDNTGFWVPCPRRVKQGDRNCARHLGPHGAELSAGRQILARHHRPMGNVLEELKRLFEELAAVKDDFLATIESEHFTDKERIVLIKTVKEMSDVGATIAKLQVDERLVAIKESEARLMAALVMRVLADLDLPGDTLKAAQRKIASEMKALGAGTVLPIPVPQMAPTALA